jgi:hypothetical protein
MEEVYLVVMNNFCDASFVVIADFCHFDERYQSSFYNFGVRFWNYLNAGPIN